MLDVIQNAKIKMQHLRKRECVVYAFCILQLCILITRERGLEQPREHSR